MALDPITAGFDLAKTVVDKFFPDKTEADKAQLAASLSIIQGQMATNQAEASTGSIFIGGWRPFIGWVCGLACAWNWIGISIAKFLCAYFNHPLALSAADTTEMIPLLFGMLGLGALRTTEKIKGVA